MQVVSSLGDIEGIGVKCCQQYFKIKHGFLLLMHLLSILCPSTCLKILILISFIEGVGASGPSLNIVHRTPAPAVLFPVLLGKGI